MLGHMTKSDAPPDPGTGRPRRKPRKATPKSLENAALHYLNRHATSSENLRRLLRARVERSARFHDSDLQEGLAAIDALVARLRTAGLLNDGDYAKARARALHRRGAGAPAIRARLRAKGVGRQDIDEAIAVLSDGSGNHSLRAALNYARRRRIGPYRAETARVANRDRDLAALARQGHSLDVGLQVIDCQDLDELELEAGPA